MTLFKLPIRLFLICSLGVAISSGSAQTNVQVIREDVDDLYHASLLFMENGIPLDTANVSRVLRDNTETLVWVHATFDGLPVFHHEHGYSFDRSRSLARMPGSDEPMILGEPLPDASAFPAEREPSVSREEAVEAWLAEIRSTPFFGGNYEPDRELRVTLGFYNLNAGRSEAPRLALAWHVLRSNGRLPEAIVDALSGNVLFFDSGVRTSLPVSPGPDPQETTDDTGFDPAGTWTSGRCSDRAYRRELTLSPDNSFAAIDYVSPCPPGKVCIWSGIVNRSGTWSMRNNRLIELSPTSPEERRGAPLARYLHYDGSAETMLEATPGSVANCLYERAGSSASGREQ